MSLFDRKIADLHESLRKKEISVTDLVSESFSKIKKVESNVNTKKMVIAYTYLETY